MSLVTHGKHRDYQRKFNHEEARRRYAGGEGITSLAREYGVTVNGMRRVLDPLVAKSMLQHNKDWYTGQCELCGGPCMRLVGGKAKHNPDGRTLCKRCRGDEMTERLRFDSDWTLVAVRCNMVDCANGKRWQSPDNFTRGVRSRHIREGGIHTQCRACQTRTKRLYRAKHPEAS